MPDPFIDVQDLSNYLGRDLSTDDGAVAAVDAACDICRDISEQTFNAGTATIALDGSGTDVLLLPEAPVTNAGSVFVNGIAEPNFMFTNDGRLLRGSAGMFPSTSVFGPNTYFGVPRHMWPRGRQNIILTYEYGYAPEDLPRSVRRVALELAARMVVQGVAQAETVGDVQVTYATAALDLNENELRILRRYKRSRSF